MLCRSTLIMTRSPIFKRCDIWKTQSHFGFLLSLEGGYREITGPTLTTCSTSHPLPPRNDGDQKIGVLLSQSARRTVTMGSPYLVVISRFLRLGRCSGYYRGRWGEPEDTALIFFKDERQEEREKEKKGLKCFTSCRALSLQWPLVGGQIDPENKGSFPPACLPARSTLSSVWDTHTKDDPAVPSEQMWGRVKSLKQGTDVCWLPKSSDPSDLVLVELYTIDLIKYGQRLLVKKEFMAEVPANLPQLQMAIRGWHHWFQNLTKLMVKWPYFSLDLSPH